MIFSMVNSHASVCSYLFVCLCFLLLFQFDLGIFVCFLEIQKNTSYIFIAGFLTNWLAIEISGKILPCEKVSVKIM